MRLALTILLDRGKDWSSLPELVELIGHRNAMKVVLAFGGTTLKIPPFKRLVQALVEASAAMAVFKGGTIREVAKSHGVPEDNVKRVYETLMENRRLRKSILKRVAEQDDKDFIYESTNDVRF